MGRNQRLFFSHTPNLMSHFYRALNLEFAGENWESEANVVGFSMTLCNKSIITCQRKKSHCMSYSFG